MKLEVKFIKVCQPRKKHSADTCARNLLILLGPVVDCEIFYG